MLEPAAVRAGCVVAGAILLPVLWWAAGAGVGLYVENWLRRRHGLAPADPDAAGARAAAGLAVLPAASLAGILLAAAGGVRVAGFESDTFLLPQAAGAANVLAAGLLMLAWKDLRPAVPRREVFAGAMIAAGLWLAACWGAVWGLLAAWRGWV